MSKGEGRFIEGQTCANVEEKYEYTYDGREIMKNVWNRPSWDKVGLKFIRSQLDPNFLPFLAPTNHLSVLVDISIFFYLKEIFKESALGRFFHRVAMSACMFVPFPCDFFRGLSLASLGLYCIT